jgi:membrane-associated phospholipid phosphatase
MLRLALWMLSGITVLSGYAVAKLEPFATATSLPLTEIDHAIPFLPWTVWLYGTVTWTTLFACLHVPDRLHARRLYFTLALSAVISWLVFFAFPTSYPRELFPLVDDGSATVRELLDIREADSPTNCFPSLHVALAFGIALCWNDWLRARWARPLPFLWAAVVSFCTLTTKQHYFVDVPAGMVVGILAWWAVRSAVREDVPAAWARFGRPLTLAGDEDRAAVRALRERVAAHQWSLDDVPFPTERQRPLERAMVRLLNQVIYIEEIAAQNFALLRDASADEDLRVLYAHFADEERRHAEGLRRVLAVHGATLQGPGLGNALVLHQFDTLDPRSDADAVLVAVSTPVFETFLDAGTIPFLRDHPALKSAWFAELERRITRDESAHLALNWILTRHAARTTRPFAAIRYLLNPSMYRGILAIPFMCLDVYALAYRLGYDFRTLLPAFGRLWKLHRRYPELRAFPLWWIYRAFCVCGVVAASAVLLLDRLGLMFGWFWITVTRVTDLFARLLFGRSLLVRRGIPT